MGPHTVYCEEEVNTISDRWEVDFSGTETCRKQWIINDVHWCLLLWNRPAIFKSTVTCCPENVGEAHVYSERITQDF